MLRITAFDDPSTYGGAAWELAKREIATLQSQLTASQERERILREGLREYARFTRDDIAKRTIKAAEEVKG